MDLEAVIQSEVRKRKTNIVYESIYMESRKRALVNLFKEKKRRYRQTGWTCGHSGGKRG